MRVPQDWDRPILGSRGASFYPPLRFPELDKEGPPAQNGGGCFGGHSGTVNRGGTFGSNGGFSGGGTFGSNSSALTGGSSTFGGNPGGLHGGGGFGSGSGAGSGGLNGSTFGGTYGGLNGNATLGGGSSTLGAPKDAFGSRDAFGLKDANGSSFGGRDGGMSGGLSNGTGGVGTTLGSGFGGGANRDTFGSSAFGGTGAFGGAEPTPSFSSTDHGREREQRGRSPPREPHSAVADGTSLPPPHAAASSAPDDVEVRGDGNLPGPWKTWDSVNFPARVRQPLIAAGFPAPTVIQQYAWPILATRRDLIGVAKTGSGKTLSFLLPCFAHLVESGADLRGPPAVLVLAPTRELAVQIEQEAKKFGTVAGMHAACLYGGAPKGPQLAQLRTRPQVLVATPGRLNDLLDPPLGMTLAVDVKSVKFLILDEADRMLDMGFEPQIRKIIAQLPTQRQTVMFTATWPAAVRRLASEFLENPVEVRAGEVEQLRVNPDIEQRVVFCNDMREKEDHVTRILREAGEDQAIVFVNTKRMCESVALRIDSSVAIHGDKDQAERDRALGMFKTGQRRVLCATDVAARGLDIKTVRMVINFDPPPREEDYVHRVGRTGRAGLKGTAVTLLTNDDGSAGRSIANIFKTGGIPVPEELERRLASGEMRMGGGSGRARSAGPGPRLGGFGGRRGSGGLDDDDFDFGGGSFGGGGFGGRDRDRFGGGSFGGGFGGRDTFSSSMCMTDCPTY